MALIGMPVVVLCMGGEMLYILEQRLHAQGITAEKASKGTFPPRLLVLISVVVGDVMRTMTGEKFTNELFRPQDLYPVQSVRGIFERLAHSSVMKLNSQSMDKVFQMLERG